jgi:hypothetical protein
VEVRAIREIIKARDQVRVMYVRMDDAAVNGASMVSSTAATYAAEEVARMIRQRVELLL